MARAVKIILIVVILTIVVLRRWKRKRASAMGGVSPAKPGDGSGPGNDDEPKNTSPEDFIASIPSIAEDHVKQCNDIFSEELDYSDDSIARLDDIINRGWPDGPPAMLETMVITFGAYLGEAIKRNLGGNWGYSDEEGYFLENVGGKVKAFPFAKAAKRFTEGEDESIGFYYAAMKHVIENEER